jgi:hypothetical protein
MRRSKTTGFRIVLKEKKQNFEIPMTVSERVPTISRAETFLYQELQQGAAQQAELKL